jgi:hypothetical protein
MTTQTGEVATCVSRYAARLHAAIGTGHQVASPLGAWLLLALTAPASAEAAGSGSCRAALTEALGCDADTAARAAADLLAHPHPVIGSGAGVWTAPGAAMTERFRSWQQSLPPQVSSGEIPDQAALNGWAREHTLGLIDRFPVDAGGVYLLLATALATRVSWQVPFALAPSADLGQASAWSRQLTRVLRTPDPEHQRGHRRFIAATAEAGDVAVHAAAAQHGLLVYSVAAAPEVPAASVLAAAHRIGCADATGGQVTRRSLAELPLGDGPAWLIREESPARGGDICTAVLPSWSATSGHDLRDPSLGFGAAKNALAPGPDPWQARQAAMARYSRTGFEAAAVTAMAVRASLARPGGSRRVAVLRFGHPYAVVAVAIDGNDGGWTTHPGQRAWHGVPVFSAWVAQPQDATQDDGPAAASPGRPA